jgi:hypothetical protein
LIENKEYCVKMEVAMDERCEGMVGDEQIVFIE